MATREVIEWVCDVCGSTDDVMTYEAEVGGGVQLDACQHCGDEVAEVLAALETATATARHRLRVVG